MNLRDEIEESQLSLAMISGKYAKDCTFGNNTEELRVDMLRMYAYIRTMERNESRNKALPINYQVADGQKVDFSSLKSQGNNLILNIKSFTQKSCIEYRLCLSDSEVCKIVELARALAYKYNC